MSVVPTYRWQVSDPVQIDTASKKLRGVLSLWQPVPIAGEKQDAR